jgi:pimeloyl-ACP methyl ester carboxylesterase
VILCVHGIGSSRKDFERLGRALAPAHRVVAYDQRGHGEASVEESIELNRLADDLCAVARAVGDVTTVVGHSWGGAVALVGGPEVAKSLVLVDPMIRVLPGTFYREYVDDLGTLLGEPEGEGREQAIRAAFAGADPLDREGKVHAMRRLQLETIRRLGRENRVDEGGWDLRPQLAALTIPTTILLAGEESVVTPDDIVGAPAAVRVVTVDQHGHALHRSAFDRFVSAVRDAASAAAI